MTHRAMVVPRPARSQATGADDVRRTWAGEDQQVSLRVILAHMIEETARHAGHADILRELIDGTTVD
jgi:hypothetical protein